MKKFHRYPTKKTAQNLGILMRCIDKAGGCCLYYTPEELRRMSALTLIKRISPNNITFIYTKESDE